ncbi:Histidine kinase [Mucilaginibacter sp. OK268]|uniref:sensor histidine kinase n=1 Tax=Mucilaginibacter sp. OK268 TaxID=1881048 RepID=UPI0008911E74|nr:sensor histidine kinase [Mucilaginibacter sp. OK268]SDP98287.1 Histidine kinase [Mucilaginibacter sp. OK268]
MVNKFKRMVNNTHGIHIFWHLIFWGSFIVYELSVLLILSSGEISLLDQIVHYPLNIALFYYNAMVLLRNFSEKKHNWFVSFLILLPLEIIVYLALNYGLNYMLESWFHVKVLRSIRVPYFFFVASVWRAIYFIGLSTCYWFALYSVYNKRKILQLENERMKSESRKILLEKDLLATHNSLLRAQINPHLLFNTLNYIYNTVYKSSEEAAEVIMLLSEITHYSFKSTGSNETVSLKDEVVAIENLIKLNQIRFNNKLCIELILKGDFEGIKIIPLVLLTFVENIFKYANLSDGDFPVQIYVGLDNGSLSFYTINKIGRTHSMPHNNNKLGLVNVKNRLENQYKRQYDLTINNRDGIFSIDLNINLHEHNKVLYN